MGREFRTCTAVRPVANVLHGVATEEPVSWAPWLGGLFVLMLLSGAVWFGRRTTRDLD